MLFIAKEMVIRDEFFCVCNQCTKNEKQCFQNTILVVMKGQLHDGSGHVAIEITAAGSTSAFLNKPPETQITPHNSLLTPEVCSIATTCTHQRNQLIYTHSCVKAESSQDIPSMLKEIRIFFCCEQWWWLCKAETSEVYWKTAFCPLASDEASVWFVGKKSGIQDILKGLQALAQEEGLWVRLDKAWGKTQQGLMGFKSLEKSRLGQYSVGTK